MFDLNTIVDTIGIKPYYSDDAVMICNADCREVLPLLPDKSIDLVLTDPPYNVGKKYGEYNDHNPEYWDLMGNWFFAANQKTDLIIFTPGAMNLTSWIAFEKPFWVACWYHSNACSHSPLGGFLVWEPILIYGKQRRKATRDGWNIPIGYQSSVGNKHPVPKPTKLFDQLVLEFSDPDNIILDPFLGSGTTAYCAKKLGRKCIGIEIEEKYCDIAAKRCSQTVMSLNC